MKRGISSAIKRSRKGCWLNCIGFLALLGLLGRVVNVLLRTESKAAHQVLKDRYLHQPQQQAKRRSVEIDAPATCQDKANQTWMLPFAPSNFLIIAGVQKGGTSALRGMLVEHPQVVASLKYEPHFFDHKLYRYLDRKYQADEIQPGWLCDIQRHYIQSTFHPIMLEKAAATASLSSAPPLYFFEKTPSYLVDPRVPSLIQQICPWQPKILILLRNPIDRAYSHFKMEREKRRVKVDLLTVLHREVTLLRQLGLSEAPLLLKTDDEIALQQFVDQLDPLQFQLPNLDTATSDQAHIDVMSNLTNVNFLQRGMYSSQLQRWLKLFPLGINLLILKFEDLQHDPIAVYKKVLQFWGVPPPATLNAADFSKTYQTRGLQRQKNMVHPPMTNATRQYLEMFFQPYNQQLEEMLGRKFYASTTD